MYVYVGPSDSKLFTVGFYRPDGQWEAESDWQTSEQAATRVAYLNGEARATTHSKGDSMIKNFGDLLVRFRAWRLNRRADSLLRRAERHKRAATQYSNSASRYWMQSSDMRALSRRIRAA